MSSADLKGLAVSTTSADALAAYERGVDLFLRWRTGALDALDVAAQRDPRSCTARRPTSRRGWGGRTWPPPQDVRPWPWPTRRATSASACTWAPWRRCSVATRWRPTTPWGGSRP